MQRIDPLNLYWSNVKDFFFKPYQFQDDPLSLYGLIWVIHTALLPVTLTIGAGTKTIVDMATRHPLSEKDMDNLINAIPTLSEEQFDELISIILQYTPRSDTSKKLIEDLKQACDDEAEVVSQLTGKLKNDLKNEKVQAIISKLSPKEIVYADITASKNYSFTQAELADIHVTVLRKTEEEFEVTRRKTQLAAITDYLKSSKNVGKKMGRVIMDEARKYSASLKGL